MGLPGQRERTFQSQRPTAAAKWWCKKSEAAPIRTMPKEAGKEEGNLPFSPSCTKGEGGPPPLPPLKEKGEENRSSEKGQHQEAPSLFFLLRHRKELGGVRGSAGGRAVVPLPLSPPPPLHSPGPRLYAHHCTRLPTRGRRRPRYGKGKGSRAGEGGGRPRLRRRRP